MARVLVTRRLPGMALNRLASEHEIEVWAERLPPSHDVLRGLVGEAEGLLCLLTDDVDADLISGSTRLRAISNYAVGVDNVAVNTATARGIPVGNTPDVLTETTADLAVALMLGISRRLVDGSTAVREGDWLTWEPDFLLGRDLHGATVGIVGLGRIGKAVARRLEGFGVQILHASGSGGVSLEHLLDASDFVTLHCPLTEQTRGMIGEAELRRMRSTAYLINTARGPIVDPAALTRALTEGRIGGAALDVTDPEPLPAEHPLLGAPNLLVIPHLGSATHRTRERMADLAVDNLLAALRGERMPHCVNPDVYR